MNNNYNSNTNITFTGLLTLIFITLKLTGFINWSWWWVLSPIWISLVIILVIIFIAIIVSNVVGRGDIGKKET